MEKRVLLAILLSFVVLYLYQALVVKPVPPSRSSNAPSATVAAPPAANPAAAPAAEAVAPPASPTPSPPQAQALVADTAERDVKVETRDVIAVLTNRGARLKSWKLKHYFDQQKQPQELAAERTNQPFPLRLRVPDEAVTQTINTALYAVTGVPAGVADSSPVDLRFEYRDSGGVSAVKTFHFEPTTYVVTLQTAVTHG